MPPVEHPLRTPFLNRGCDHPSEKWALRPEAGKAEFASRTRQKSLEIVAAAESALGTLDLEDGLLVGVRAAPGPAFLEALVAAWGCGLCPVLLDPTTTDSERENLNQRLGISWDWAWEDGWTEDLGCPRKNLFGMDHEARSVPGAAVLKLTSGSTGPARGIAVSAEALVADTTRLAAVMGFHAEDRLLAAVPLSHSYGFSVLTAPSLLFGATLCFPGEFDGLEASRRTGATFLPSVPSWFRAILPLAKPDDFAPSLRLFLSAGAPLASQTARSFREKFGQPICVLYGASECGGIAYDATGEGTERGSVGKILPGVRIELGETSSSGGQPVSVHSNAVAQAYVPSQPGDVQRLDGCCYRSEDLARIEDDELFLMGRTSDWINVRAKKVNPREVEAVIAGLSGVDEVFVHGFSPVNRKAEAGETQEEQVRAVVASSSGAIGARAVRDWCATRLAPHKRPRAIVILESLPRTGRGKLDRVRLLASPSSSSPEGGKIAGS